MQNREELIWKLQLVFVRGGGSWWEEEFCTSQVLKYSTTFHRMLQPHNYIIQTYMTVRGGFLMITENQSVIYWLSLRNYLVLVILFVSECKSFPIKATLVENGSEQCFLELKMCFHMLDPACMKNVIQVSFISHVKLKDIRDCKCWCWHGDTVERFAFSHNYIWEKLLSSTGIVMRSAPLHFQMFKQ